MPMNRKSFLEKSLSTALIAGAIASLKDPLSAQEAKETKASNSCKKAVVLGGGLAGLYSAYLLRLSGYSVQIVEASSRLGGRVKTIRDEKWGFVSDIGGEWIGEGQSDIISLTKQLKLELKPSPHASHFHLFKDKEVSFLDLSDSSAETLKRMIDLHKTMSNSQKQGLDKIDFLTYAKYQGITEEDVRKLNDAYKIFLGSSLEHLSSESVLSDLSSPQSSLQADYYIKGGADKMISGLLELMPDVEVVLNEPATKITQLKSEVQVELANKRVLKSNIIVCALPTKALLEIKWTPSLPKDLLYSLLRTKYGKIQKNIIVCEKKSGIEPQFFLTETPAQALYIANEDSIGEAIAVTSLVTEDRVNQIENGSEENRRRLLQNSLLELKSKTKWSMESNDSVVFSSLGSIHNRGAVSIYPPGSFGIKDAWKSNFERVHFAGEHLAEHNGTMDGAISSALRAISGI